MTLTAVAAAVYRALQAIGLVDYAKDLVAKSSPARRTRAASAVLLALPFAWRRCRPHKFTSDEECYAAVGIELGKILWRHNPELTGEAFKIVPAWIRAQRALEAAAGDLFGQAEI